MDIINKLADGGGKVLVRLPGAKCEVMCDVHTRFEVDTIISTLSRNGVKLAEFPLGYKKFLGNPGARLRKVKNLAERNSNSASKNEPNQ